MKKYEMTDETKTLDDGTVLHRIRAVRDFTLANGAEVLAGDLGGWIEKEDNLSHGDSAWVYGSARVYGDAWVYDDARVHGDAEVKSARDYAVFKNGWSSGRWFTYTRYNKMWAVGCFYGTGDELIAKAYRDSELSGRCYEAIVRAQEAIDRAFNEA